MPKSITELHSDLVDYLGASCSETGHCTFDLRSKRLESDALRIVLDATPSQDYEAENAAMATARASAGGCDTPNAPIRTVEDVADFIVGLLNQIWRQADGNGRVDVQCRQQKNGKIRIAISHMLHNKEIILRPDEISFTVVSPVPAR